jgi:hypothetical protein
VEILNFDEVQTKAVNARKFVKSSRKSFFASKKILKETILYTTKFSAIFKLCIIQVDL